MGRLSKLYIDTITLYLIEFGNTDITFDRWHHSQAYDYYIKNLPSRKRRELNKIVYLAGVGLILRQNILEQYKKQVSKNG